MKSNIVPELKALFHWLSVGGEVAEPDPCSSNVERMNQLQTEQATPDNKQDVKLTNY